MHSLAFCSSHAHTCSTMPTQLWQRLRQARRYADLTQAQLAAECGVSRGAVALWEADEVDHRTKPTTDHLIAISKATGAPLEWLMNDASELDALWRLNGEFGASPQAPSRKPTPAPDVLPDLLQDGHLFLFAQTPEQLADKLEKAKAAAPGVQPHLVLIGTTATVHTVDTPAAALSAVVRLLTKS